MKIGIIGNGFVGNATSLLKCSNISIIIYDINPLLCIPSNTTLENICDCDLIFISVPTPMNKDGSCHTDIVESVVKDIDDRVDLGNISKPIVVIKSTIPPGTTDRLHKKYKGVNVIFNPEFLTEANYLEVFKNQKRIILGGVRQGTNKLRQIYSKVFPHATIVKTGSKTAEMVKYFTNTFLATKVSFANEMYSVCEQIGIDYDKVVEYATYDERLGKSHWAVPGPDGDYGFGGHCLQKDLSAIINQFDTYGLLEAVEEVNNQVREDRDWEHMVGRAVLEEED